MSVATFIPEFWSKKLLSSLKPAHVYGALCNTDYEGEITEAGDTVTINSVGRPTITPYIPNVSVIVPEKLTTAQRKLVVDQSDSFAFGIDDVDKRQANGGLMEEATKEAAFGFAQVTDLYLEGIMRAGASNDLGTIGVVNPADVYDKLLIPAKIKLDRANVPVEGRWAVLTPEQHGLILLDPRFIDYDKSGNTEGKVNGIVGRAAGFDLIVSNNAPVITGDDYAFMAGHRMATSYAEQINKTEAYRPESSFEDAIKGLHLYGGKVVRPEALVKAAASVTAP